MDMIEKDVSVHFTNNLLMITANWTEARTIKYTNFPAKYMNSRSEIASYAERHSWFNTSSKSILLVFDFYRIFWHFSH